jgi:hypothetical protein
MKVYTLTLSQLTSESNKVKDILLESLLKEKIIDKETYEKSKKYCIVVHEKGFFGSILKKLFKSESQTRYTIVKLIDID